MDIRRFPAAVLVQLYRLDTAPFPLEMTRNVLDKADSNDDRVWLARANLAIKTGRFDVAGGWLDACLKRRPDDLAAWRSRLELAVAQRRRRRGLAGPRPTAGRRALPGRVAPAPGLARPPAGR